MLSELLMIGSMVTTMSPKNACTILMKGLTAQQMSKYVVSSQSKCKGMGQQD